MTDGHLPNNEGSSLELHNPVYLGSDLKSTAMKVCIAPQSLFLLFFSFKQPYHTFPQVYSHMALSSPLVLPQGHNIPMNSVIGCIRDFKINEEAVGEPGANHKTSPCLDGAAEMGTYFGGGHLILGLTLYFF